jgi:hypothetical protein
MTNDADHFLEFISSPQNTGISPDWKKLMNIARSGAHANNKGIGIPAPDLGHSSNPAHFLLRKVVVDNEHIVVQGGFQDILAAGKRCNLSPQLAGEGSGQHFPGHTPSMYETDLHISPLLKKPGFSCRRNPFGP